MTTDADRQAYDEARAADELDGLPSNDLEARHRRVAQQMAGNIATALVETGDAIPERLWMLEAVTHDVGVEAATRHLHRFTVERLARLRSERDALNDAIRVLVDEERVLGLAVTRFDRLATTTTEA